MKASEWALCQENGVTDIVEIKIGYDGIVVATAKRAPEIAMTARELFQAVAAELPKSDADCTLLPNENERWSDINPEFPPTVIEIFGPPPTSGTRDAFVEIGLEAGALSYPCLADLREENKSVFQSIAHKVREDGRWIDAGENDNAIVQTLDKAENAVGVFGYSFLDQNRDSLRGAVIDGASPTFENIASGHYAISRSLYIYMKAQHIDLVDGMTAFAAEITSEAASGADGYLAFKGLVPLPDDERVATAEKVANLETLSADVFAPAEAAAGN